MGCCIIRTGSKILSWFACRTCCYAGCQGNMLHYAMLAVVGDFKPNHVAKLTFLVQCIPTVIQEALRTRGLKDDTTCIVVDIIPPDNELPPTPPPKKRNKLKDFFSFKKRSRDTAGKLSKKLSAINIVEELFEEGSAMLAER